MVTEPLDDWSGLRSLGAEARTQEMATRFRRIAMMGEDDRTRLLHGLVETVYALPDGDIRQMTESRLRAWLRLDSEDARVVADSYGQVLDRMSSSIALKRVAIVQSVASHLTPEEQERLRQLIPGIVASGPVRLSAEPSRAGTPDSSKPWWAFWRA